MKAIRCDWDGRVISVIAESDYSDVLVKAIRQDLGVLMMCYELDLQECAERWERFEQWAEENKTDFYNQYWFGTGIHSMTYRIVNA